MYGPKIYLLLVFQLLAGWLYGQNRTLSGQVTDAAGEPLIGVSVLVKGTPQGAATDLNGRYRLEIPASESVTLVFTYIGMESTERSPGNRSVLNVIMREDVSTIEEVVITAYAGPKKEKDLVGSYQQINADELRADRPIESLDKLLDGQVAGVQIESGTGEPGLPVRVRIRGEGSLVPVGSTDVVSSGQPLFVIDGVPLYDITETNTANSEFSSVIEQRLNPLALINPEDIESVVVLKDAAATAIYGANASNGVVLITTKRGRAGQTQIKLSMKQGIQEPINEIRFLNTQEYLELYRETLFNSGKSPAEAGPSHIETDWRDLVTRTGRFSDLDLSLSGGNDRSRFRFSAAYLNQQAISKGNSNERFSARLSLDHELNKKLDFTTGFSGAYGHKESFNSFGVFSFPPNIPAVYPDGSFNNDGFFANRANPLAALEQNDFFHDQFNFNGNVALTYEPVEGLRLKTLAGFDSYQNEQNRYDSALNGSGRSRNGFARRFNRNNFQWISTTQLSWNKTLGEDHHLGFLSGLELTRKNRVLLKVTATDFPFDDLRQLGTVSNDNTDVNESRFTDATRSLFGQLSYDWKYRYYLSANVRRDASSIFGGDVQANNFFAIGLAWAFGEEPFLAGWDWLEYGKLRFSYGLTGNSRLGTYTARGLYRISNDFGYGNQAGLAPSAAPNDRLSWETRRKLNLGLDLHFLENRLKLTLEYFRDQIDDAISTIEIPRESGFSRIVANNASMRNWGWEASLQTLNLKGPLRWTTNFNIAANYNRITKLAVERPPGSTNVAAGLIVGNDVNAIYGVRTAGVDPYNGKPLWYLPDGSITDDARLANLVENRVVIGRSTPEFYGGITNNFSYKALTVSLFIKYSYGRDIVVNELTFTDGRQIAFNNQSVNQLDRWQQPGDLTDTPRLHESNFPARNNTRYLFDDSYLQFSNLQLSYRLPSNWTDFLHLENVNVFGQVNNLGYVYTTKTRKNRNGIAEYRYLFPESRTFVFGINLGI